MQYPMSFKSHSETPSGINSTWYCEASEHSTKMAIPTEFDGPGGGLSPEDLFNQALTNCFIATFKVYAQMSKLHFTKLETESDLTVDLDENKKPIMKKIIVRVKFYKASDKAKALVLAEKASKSGFILNSVKTEREFHFEFLD
jgi:organic hydroperoxide reductase OsmC/OhrA